MLSKTERNYLSGTIKLNKNYENKIIFSIRKKIQQLEEDLRLIESGNNDVFSLGKLTSYQTKLTPLEPYSLIMIKYLNS